MRNNSEEELDVYEVAPAYVNGFLHLGHLLEIFHWYALGKMSDPEVLKATTSNLKFKGQEIEALIRKLSSKKAPLISWGSDVNGTPILRKVLAQNPDLDLNDPRSRPIIDGYVDQYEELNKEAYRKYGLLTNYKESNQDYYRTDEPKVKKLLSEFMEKVKSTGRLVLKEHPSPYCVNCKTNLPKIDIKDIEIPGHRYLIDCFDEEGLNYKFMTTTPKFLRGAVFFTYKVGDVRYSKLQGKTLKIPLKDGTSISAKVKASSVVSEEVGSGLSYVTAYGNQKDIEILRELGYDKGSSLYDPKGNLMIKTIELEELVNPPSITESPVKISIHAQRKDCNSPIIITSSPQLLVVPTEEDIENMLKRVGDRSILNKTNPIGTELKQYFNSKSLKAYIERLEPWCISRDKERSYSVEIPGYEQYVGDTWLLSSLLTNRLKGKYHRFQGSEIERTWLGYTLFVEEIMGRKNLSSVFIHGLVLDSMGRKISKSLGNAPDLESMIKKYGLASLRKQILSNDYTKNFKFNETQVSRWERLDIKLGQLENFFELNSSKESNLEEKLLTQDQLELVGLKKYKGLRLLGLFEKVLDFREEKVLSQDPHRIAGVPMNSAILCKTLDEVYFISRKLLKNKNSPQNYSRLLSRVRELKAILEIYN